MKLPVPRPGLVVRYGFLWRREAERGLEEAAKDRPCVVVVAVKKAPDGDICVVVAPVTSAPPRDPTASLEIPTAIREALGLSPNRQWLRFDELNRFVRPGFDLRPIPGRNRVDYGMLPRGLFEAMRSAILDRQRRTRRAPVDCD